MTTAEQLLNDFRSMGFADDEISAALKAWPFMGPETATKLEIRSARRHLFTAYTDLYLNANRTPHVKHRMKMIAQKHKEWGTL